MNVRKDDHDLTSLDDVEADVSNMQDTSLI